MAIAPVLIEKDGKKTVKLSLRGNLTKTTHILKALTHPLNPSITKILELTVTDDATIFDVGAHSGHFCRIFSRFAKNGKVYAFEPSCYALSILQRVKKLKRLNNVTIIPSGLGAKEQEITLNIPVKRGRSMGFGLSHLGKQDSTRQYLEEKIYLTTLDKAVTELGLERLDFIKVDIEGYELNMLRGGVETIKKFRPVLFIEMIDHFLRRNGDSLASAWEFLHDLGYEAHTFKGATLKKQHSPINSDIIWLPRKLKK